MFMRQIQLPDTEASLVSIVYSKPSPGNKLCQQNVFILVLMTSHKALAVVQEELQSYIGQMV